MYLRARTRRGHTYYSVVRGVRSADKVRQENVLTLGRLDTLTPDERRTLENQLRELGDPKLLQQFRALLRDLGHADLTPLDGITVERALDYGAVAALHRIAIKLNLIPLVEQHFRVKGGGPRLGKLIVAQAIRRCIDPGSILAMPPWYERTALPAMLDLPTHQVTEDTLYNSLDYITPEGVKAFHKAAWQKVRAHYTTPEAPTFYDLTTSYFEGTQCALAKFGYSEEHRPDKLQITVGIAVNPDMVPLHHDVYEGNQGQAPTMIDVRERVLALGLQKPILVVDRGPGSDGNRAELRKAGIQYIMALRADPKVRKVLRSTPAEAFRSVVVPEGASPLSVCEVERIIREKEEDEVEEVKLRRVLTLNPDKAKNDAEYREHGLKRAEEALAKLVRQQERKPLRKKDLLMKARSTLKRFGVSKFLRLKVNARGPPTLTWLRNGGALRWAAALDGKAAFETSCPAEELSTEQVALAYRDRDVVEKFIQCLKDIVQLRPHYVRTPEHVRGRAFVCVLAVLLLAVLRLELKAAGKEMTSVAALHVLEGVRRVELSPEGGGAVVVRTTRLTGEQKELAHVLGIAL